MLSKDISEIGGWFAGIAAKGRDLPPEFSAQLAVVLSDFAERALALERQIVPPGARLTSSQIESITGVVSLDAARAAKKGD